MVYYDSFYYYYWGSYIHSQSLYLFIIWLLANITILGWDALCLNILLIWFLWIVTIVILLIIIIITTLFIVTMMVSIIVTLILIIIVMTYHWLFSFFLFHMTMLSITNTLKTLVRWFFIMISVWVSWFFLLL
jgi:hypothetical protein